MEKKESSLRRRMLLMLLACILPMLTAITFLFAETMQSQQRADADTLSYAAQDIGKVLERYASGVYNVSDAFSNDEKLLEILDRDYSDNPNGRQGALTYANNALFESYNRLQQQKKIDAIYAVNRRDVFDFLDPNQDVDALIEQLEELKVNDKDKMGHFYWYPMRENFLTTGTYEESRRNHIVLGSRRVYSALKSGYPYIHLFAVEEQTLYEQYEFYAKQLKAAVYIVEDNGGLISSTEEEAVEECRAPDEVLTAVSAMQENSGTIRWQGKRYNTAWSRSDLTGWTAIAMVPANTVTSGTMALFVKVIAVIAVCVGILVLLLLLLYRRFMDPLAQLEVSIRKVKEGDFQAYVQPTGQPEVSQMLQSYNTMLDDIRANMDARVNMEKMKKDLEMQVLVSQINPHFLYNTLETIVWKAGRSDIGKLAASLGKLYRLSITGGLFIPLLKELEHAQMYMNIQESRYTNKVHYEVTVEGCDANRVQTLKLILQPVIENCFLYGMEGQDRVLEIQVDIVCREGCLVIRVTDDGAGMDAESLEKLQRQIVRGRDEEENQKNCRSTGIGLHNIYARLRLYAGEQCRVEVSSAPGRGMTVTLIQPYREQEMCNN